MEGKESTYKKYSFPKQERLSSKKLIDALFSKGASFYLYPFSIRYLPADSSVSCHQFMATVSKRNFKRAVDRNRIKRLVKEAYRLQKGMLDHLSSEHRYLLIAYIYVGKEIHPYHFIETKLVSALERLTTKLEKSLLTKN